MKKVFLVTGKPEVTTLPKRLGLDLREGKEYSITGTDKVRLTANNAEFSGTVFINLDTLLASGCGQVLHR